MTRFKYSKTNITLHGYLLQEQRVEQQSAQTNSDCEEEEGEAEEIEVEGGVTIEDRSVDAEAQESDLLNEEDVNNFLENEKIASSQKKLSKIESKYIPKREWNLPCQQRHTNSSIIMLV